MSGESRPDVILQGGQVIDPLHGHNGVMDVAISGGKIAAVGPNLSTEGVPHVINVRGLYVTPGIIDMHAHVFAAHKRSKLSLDPRVNTFSSGVTTVVDAGSSGWRTFEDFKQRIIDRSRTRVLAFLNIVGEGMRGGNFEQNLARVLPGTLGTNTNDPTTATGAKLGAML